MSNLLEDPVFFGLLTNNAESNMTRSSSNSSGDSHVVVGGAVNLPVIQCKPAQPQQQQQNFDLKNDPLDFSFLKKLTYSTASSNPVNLAIPSTFPLSFDTQSVNSSYQPSIFSEAVSTESYEEAPAPEYKNSKNQVNNLEILNSFKSIEELTGQNFLKDVPSNIDPVAKDNEAHSSDKKFHKYYTDLSSSSSNTPSTSASPINKSLTYHKCPFCQRPFKNKSYLSRHLKKHDVIKEFKCPFFNETTSKCHHLNGEFSRKDTFKAHLKSIHFVYPIGVTKGDRSLSSGRCAGCFKEFINNNIWMNEHIDAGLCPAAQKEEMKEEA